MNVYVDNLITFEYSEDYLLEVGKQNKSCIFQTYALTKGNTTIIILLLDKRTWNSLENQRNCSINMPDLFKDDSPLAPRFSRDVTDYNANGFVGKAYWLMTHSKQNKLLYKGLSLFVTRKSNRLNLDIGDKKEFTIDVTDSLLRTLFFAGEEGYFQRASQGSRSALSPSPYHIQLSCFAKQDAAGTSKTQFNVRYDGVEITEEQTLALKLLVENEKLIFQSVVNEVFEYYTKTIYPLLQEAGLCTEEHEENFPTLDEPSEIVPYIELVSVQLYEPRDNGDVPIGLMFECSWDEEHGVGVRLNSTSVEKVSIQGDLMRDD
jgi:hypothetical protein